MTRRSLVARVDTRHMGPARTATQKRKQRLDLTRLTLGDHLDGSIGQVAHPPREAQPTTLPEGRRPEAHALHATANDGVQANAPVDPGYSGPSVM